MKIVEQGIYELLKGLAGGEVTFMRAKDKAPGPFIVLQRVDGTRWRSINKPSGMAQASVQVDCYAGDYLAAKTLAADAEGILDGYRGTVYYGPDSPQEAVRIGGISLQNEVDLFDQTDEPFLYRHSAVYLVTYEQ